MTNVAILLGNNLFIGDPVLIVEIDGKMVNFFKVRELFRVRSNGSYLTIDCDIKDKDNKREIKLERSKPVAKPGTVNVIYNHNLTHVTREDGSTVIKIEQIESTDPTLINEQRITSKLTEEKIESVIRITGDFYAGNIQLVIDNNMLSVGTNRMSGARSKKSGGLRLFPNGFQW